jgi:heme-degrading monooxygenase HmoA
LAELFRQEAGFVATELSRDSKDPRRYLTLDFWESKLAYERFRAERAEEYTALDAQCETFTEFERELGQFERVRP